MALSLSLGRPPRAGIFTMSLITTMLFFAFWNHSIAGEAVRPFGERALLEVKEKSKGCSV